MPYITIPKMIVWPSIFLVEFHTCFTDMIFYGINVINNKIFTNFKHWELTERGPFQVPVKNVLSKFYHQKLKVWHSNLFSGRISHLFHKYHLLWYQCNLEQTFYCFEAVISDWTMSIIPKAGSRKMKLLWWTKLIKLITLCDFLKNWYSNSQVSLHSCLLGLF